MKWTWTNSFQQGVRQKMGNERTEYLYQPRWWYKNDTVIWLKYGGLNHCQCYSRIAVPITYNRLPFSPLSFAITQPGSWNCQSSHRDIKKPLHSHKERIIFFSTHTHTHKDVDTDTHTVEPSYCAHVCQKWYNIPSMFLVVTLVPRIRLSLEQSIKLPSDWHTLTFPAKLQGTL